MTAGQAWTGITDLADQAVVLPLALLVLVALLPRGRGGVAGGRAARGWALAVGGVLLALLALKLLGGACQGAGQAGIVRGPALGSSGLGSSGLGSLNLGSLGLRSPSGHTAAGGIVYGGLLALVLRRGATVSALCCLALAAVFGASRLALGVHTPAEAALGCVVAAAGGAVLARASGWPGGSTHPAAAPGRPAGAARGRSDAWAWIAAALALVWTLHGRRLPAEPAIAAVASAWLSPLCGR